MSEENVGGLYPWLIKNYKQFLKKEELEKAKDWYPIFLFYSIGYEKLVVGDPEFFQSIQNAESTLVDKHE